jgi:tetratricopeptide (TPR) repeat protein
MTKPFAGGSFLKTLGLTLLATAALFVADTFLAKTERAETLVEAAHLFAQGRALMQRGEYATAIDRIKDAIANARGNRDYRRTLAEAELAAGRTADAESTLTDLLQSDSTDGLASLIMGRVVVKEARYEEAVSYFHRAIDGRWGEDAAGNRLQVRFELVDLLAKRNSKEELLAELLPLQEQAPGDLETRARIGRLFLLAGSPVRAADLFRGILRDAPGNADAHAGLGEAEFAQSNYRAAQRDFQAALRLAPDDQATRHHLELCDELLTLDPTIRGLGPGERFQRSLKLVELTLVDVSQCVGPNPSPELRALLGKAGNALKAPVSAVRRSEVAESHVDLAEQLWQARKKECGSPPATDRPLALVLARLSQ